MCKNLVCFTWNQSLAFYRSERRKWITPISAGYKTKTDHFKTTGPNSPNSAGSILLIPNFGCAKIWSVSHGISPLLSIERTPVILFIGVNHLQRSERYKERDWFYVKQTRFLHTQSLVWEKTTLQNLVCLDQTLWSGPSCLLKHIKRGDSSFFKVYYQEYLRSQIVFLVFCIYRLSVFNTRASEPEILLSSQLLSNTQPIFPYLWPCR